MSKLVKSTVLSHIGIFNSNSSIFHWEHPRVVHNGEKRDVVILQVLQHDEERFLVEFIFNEDAEIVFGGDYEDVKMKKSMDDSIFGKRYTIKPFEDFKDHILEKFPHEKMGEQDVKLKGANITDTDDKSTYPYPEHFTLTDIKKQECISADPSIIDVEATCDKLYKSFKSLNIYEKAIEHGDDPGAPGQDGYCYVEGYGENEQDY